MPEGLRAALAAWADDPVLAAPLADSACVHLVLDGAATTILHASAAAVPLRDAVADDDGRLRHDLAGQICSVGGGGKPRLVRLRLDPRRMAAPTLWLIAGGTLDGAPVLLLAAAGPLPGVRPRPLRTAETRRSDREAAPALPVGVAAPAAGDRFVWRTDAADRLTAIGGAPFGSLAPLLVGQGWAALAEAGRLGDADAFLAAVRGRRTFRALPATLDTGSSGTLAVDLSGACLGRGGEAFSGFGGYGVVRAVTMPVGAIEAAPPPTLPMTSGPQPTLAADPLPLRDTIPATEAGSDHPEAHGFPATRALPDTRTASWPPALVTAARFGGAWTGPVAQAASSDPAAAEPAEVPPIPEPAVRAGPSGHPVEAPDPADAALSVTEHAAFREIARALGARYAGDEEGGDSANEAGPMRGDGGAVMPFPGPKPVEALTPPPPEREGVPPLDDLPAAVLVHRGDAVLAANRRLLDLTGYADLASLQAAGLGRLFRGLVPEVHQAGAAGADGPRLIETARGDSRPVAVEGAPTAWAGLPAACLILHPVAEADPSRERAAERLAQSFRDGHAADARGTLDALDDGVVTLDPASRIVAMNRAAAALFACDPREVVGTGFDALFATSQRDAVRASLEGFGIETRTAAGGRPLMLRVSGQDGTRVAVLRAPGDETARAASGIDGPAFLGRLDREIRTPVEGIVGLADGILAEPHGPIDERYRATLRAIRAAGGHVRGLVSDLIDLATIESGGRALAVRPLPLNELVSGCVELLQPEAARGRIVLRTSFSPDLAPLEADEPSMRQAALTVIGDAIRATGAGGQVIVSTAPGEGGGVALKVRGTGPGPRPSEAEGAPEPREGGDARGAGLGLPLTKALIEANHGHLLVSSRGNEGTLVEIHLPGPESRTG